MKKGLLKILFSFLMMVFLCIPKTVISEPLILLNGLPDDMPNQLIHDAIMTLTWDDRNGECWAEGHVILGTEVTDSSSVVYAFVSLANYGFMSGMFTEVCGFGNAEKFIFDKNETGYSLQEIQDVEDWSELHQLMPEELVVRFFEMSDVTFNFIDQQKYAQAKMYLDSIGRTESIGDILEVQTTGMLVVASNLTIAFCSPYPFWITEKEVLEDGERYIYKRVWISDNVNTDVQTYIMPDGNTLLCDGTTGVETLTKTRKADNTIVETITIRVELYDLYIIFTDDYGTIEYHFIFDGLTYHKPTISQFGECKVSYSDFDNYISYFPE